jgi:hypothetical protein
MKAKQAPRRRWFWIALAACLLIPGSCLLSMPIYWNEGYIQNTLPTQLLPTAQALLNVPLPTPDYFAAPFEGYDGYCIWIDRNKMPFLANQMLTRFVINGVPLPNKYMNWNTSPEQYCPWGIELSQGLNLMAIEFRFVPFATTGAYQWVVEVK